MHKLRILRLLLAWAPVACSGAALAANDMPAQSGFSGFLLFGGGYMDLESNTAAGNDAIDVGNRTVDSIFASPGSQDDIHPVLTGEVRYTFAEQRTQVFVGNSIDDLLELDITQRLGVRRQTDEAGTFSLAYVFTGIPPEVWEDPYVAGVARKETDRDSQGVRFE